MTSEVGPSSFCVDLMKKSDIVSLIREAETNSALSSMLDILVSIWHPATAGNPHGRSALRKGVGSAYELARSSLDLEDARGDWERWLKKRAHILAYAPEDAHTTKRNRKGFRVQEKKHIEDVARFEKAFGIEEAVILANLADVSQWYKSPKRRKELILHYLDPDGRSDQRVTLLGTKRAVDLLVADSEEHVENELAKRVCQRTKIPIEQQFRIISEPESNPGTNLFTGGAGLQQPVVHPTWTGSDQPCPLIYDGQFEIFGSTDRWIHYRWSAISAMKTMAVTQPTSSDAKWLYYHVNRSVIHMLPFAALSEIIQRSEHWTQEDERGLSVSACLCLTFPRVVDVNYGAYCRLLCIVPGADAPKQNEA